MNVVLFKNMLFCVFDLSQITSLWKLLFDIGYILAFYENDAGNIKQSSAELGNVFLTY